MLCIDRPSGLHLNIVPVVRLVLHKDIQPNPVQSGNPAAPWSVIAITFTNKAAGELKERLERMCGPASKDIWAATFHRACIRILRRDIEKLGAGFNSNFTIYDSPARNSEDCPHG